MTAVIPEQRAAGDGGRALVEAAQAGDMDAFAELWRQYHPFVLRYMTRRVTERPVAEDLAADVFMRALRKLGGFRWRGTDIGAWFITIARYRLADYTRSGRYRHEWPVGEFADADPDPESDAAAIALAMLDAAAVRAAIPYLSVDQQQVLELRYFRGLNIAETAAAMGRAIPSVKSLHSRAVKSLRRLMTRVGAIT